MLQIYDYDDEGTGKPRPVTRPVMNDLAETYEPEDKRCHVHGPDGFYTCTRVEGHRGVHVAHGMNLVPLAIWPQGTETTTRPPVTPGPKHTVYTHILGLPGFLPAGPETESADLNWEELLQLLDGYKLNLGVRYGSPWIILDSDYHFERANEELPY